jgi:poly-gamma-glutamate synthesis protein (capsule biosynthesis protein)
MNSPIEVLAVGDVLLDRANPADAFTHVQDRLDEADLLIGNHEGPLAESGDGRLFYPWLALLSAPAESVDGLEAAGFDVLSLANNQSMNYGPEALMDTIALLESRGIDVTGVGEDETAAAPVVETVRGLSVAVMGVEATRWDWGDTRALPDQPGLHQLQTSSWYPPPHVSRRSLEAFRDRVAAATEAYDAVAVLPHFGVTAGYELAATQRAIAHAAAEAGADAVVGAHPHVLQAVEVHGGVPIFYSLGNFAFDKTPHWGTNWMQSATAVAELTLGEDGLQAAELLPALYDSGPEDKPRFLDPSEPEFDDIHRLLSKLSAREGTKLEADGDTIRVPLTGGDT